MDASGPVRSHFTAHHNWLWVVSLAFSPSDNEDEGSRYSFCKRFADLPSAVVLQEKKARYSLFRLDIPPSSIASEGNTPVISLRSIRLDSPCMEDLDPKDSLYRRMEQAKVTQYAPSTQLVPWDADDSFVFDPLPTCAALLKAPLGSGGFGLYFIYSEQDAREVMRNHRKRAERVDANFLPSLLRSTYSQGHTLCWSIQAVVHPVLCRSVEGLNGLRRSQVRAYVVYGRGDEQQAVEGVGGFFLYSTLEVRLPAWHVDLQAVLRQEAEQFRGAQGGGPQCVWEDEVERECCGASHARPYNEQRSKKDTSRLLLDELEELRGVEGAVRKCLQGAFGGLKASILAQKTLLPHISSAAALASPSSSPALSFASMAVLGVDLLVTHSHTEGTEGFEAYIVEVNNNPAMPQENKQMSARYRSHLVDLVRACADLGDWISRRGSGDLLDGQGELFGSDMRKVWTAL